MIKTGDLYRMVDFPTESYAIEYCINNGFYKGCSCEIIDMFNTDEAGSFSFRLRCGKYTMEIGQNFFKDYFARDNRKKSLNILLG